MAVTLDSLKKSIGKKNANSRAFAWLADLEREAGDLDKALQRVDGGLTLYPNDVAAMLVRAKILFQKESYDSCVEECEKVLIVDPFNLAAQQIMGDAYDKLENIGERNVCYRRLHDMDPLNTFWKDEYDVVVGSVAAAAMAGEISDTDFSMPGENGSMDMSDEFKMDAPSDEFNLDEPQAAEGAPQGEDFSVDGAAESDDPFAALASMMPGSDDADDSAMEDLSASLDSALDSIAVNPPEQEMEEFPADENISVSDVGSALSDMFGLDDDLEPEETSQPAASADTDIPESIDDSAEANVSSVFSSTPVEAPASADSDEPTTIDNAFDSIFGEDELPEEKPQDAAPETAQESAQDDAAFTLDEPAAEEGGLFEKSADADMNLTGEWSPSPTPAVEDRADEVLDIDAPAEAPEAATPVAEAPAAAADEPTTIDNAFDSIFGEDELPEEKPQETAPEVAQEESAQDDAAFTLDEPAAEEGGLFEKSADADMNLTGDWSPSPAPAVEESSDEVLDIDAPAEESLSLDETPAETPAAEASVEEAPAVETPAAVADEPTTIDNAFDSIFGEDELPEEKPQEAAPEAAQEESSQDDAAFTLDEPAAEDGGLFEKSADADMNLTGDWSPSPVPAEDEAPVAETAPAPADEALDVAAADESLDLEAPADETLSLDETPAEESLSLDDIKLDDVAPAAEESTSVTLDEIPAKTETVETASEQEVAAPAEAPAETKPADDGFSVDSAFDSLFGTEDDIPEEKPQTENVEEAPAEESASLAEQVNQAESELEMPEVKEEQSDIAKEMGGAFASMFGDDDDLDLPVSKGEAEAPAENSQEATGALIEESFGKASEDEISDDLDASFDSLFGKDDSLEEDLTVPAEEKPAAETPAATGMAAEQPKDLDSLESEVSGAFKGLFDMDDDALPEEKPSNNGVDFLMSGDSDDEISAGLINNPDAPLDRGAHDLDESLNTRTLAEIYFDQGLYGKALEIYKDLVQKEPENEDIAARMAEVEKLYNEKFGGNA